MSKYNGNKLSIEILGASHSEEISLRISGIAVGEKIDVDSVQKFCNRRSAKKTNYSTSRIEADLICWEKGIENNIVNGEIFATIKNTNKRSGDYDNLKNIPRPSHADYVAREKYGDDYDFRGGGHFSGRMTAPMCIAGGIAKEILKKHGIEIHGYIRSIGTVSGQSYKGKNISELNFPNEEDLFPLLDSGDYEKMNEEIAKVKGCGNSIGGVIECVATGIPCGLADYMFDSMEGKIAQLMMAVPAVKGIEFGTGFDITTMTGYDANDNMQFENGQVVTKTNHNGGILGGITTGMPITLSVAIKPTPSISMEQDSVNLETRENVKLKIVGRHDACIVPRAVPVVEAIVAIGLLDSLEI